MPSLPYLQGLKAADGAKYLALVLIFLFSLFREVCFHPQQPFFLFKIGFADHVCVC